eukprot:scaffold1717_cov117-Cylindrotheca_fusiformis.AAC.10
MKAHPTSQSISGRPMLGVILFVFLSSLTIQCFAGTNQEGLRFLAENERNTDVVSLPSGLQYKVLKKGKGTRHPTVDSPCSCHYEGKLIDGTVFDSSYERGDPLTFAPNQKQYVRNSMQLMVAGDQWELYIPSDLAYGDAGSPPKIGGGEVLIFKMEILGILGESVPAISCKLDGTDCSEKEVKYINKINRFGQLKAKSELERITSVLEKPMSDELRDWATRRRYLLTQLLEEASTGAEF